MKELKYKFIAWFYRYFYRIYASDKLLFYKRKGFTIKNWFEVQTKMRYGNRLQYKRTLKQGLRIVYENLKHRYK